MYDNGFCLIPSTGMINRCVPGCQELEGGALAVFLYPVAQMAIPDGTLLEGHGVVPDIEVGLDREMLLKGIDSQLDSAVRSIEEETL